jgi:hypothetical protein
MSALDFFLRDIRHRILVKFFCAFLPTAKKPYYARAVYQPELDIHGIASKAETYNITTSPKIIEEGMNAGMELIYYLVADGYKINTPLFRLCVGVTGEYEGYETTLPPGEHPHGLLSLSPRLRKYLEENVQVQFDGIENNDGYLASILDKKSDKTDTVLTPGGLFVLRGSGLKIASDKEHADKAGLFYEKVEDGTRIREEMVNVAQNDRSIVSALFTQTLEADKEYRIVICTQTSAVNSSRLLKNLREVKSDFVVTITQTEK